MLPRFTLALFLTLDPAERMVRLDSARPLSELVAAAMDQLAGQQDVFNTRFDARRHTRLA